MHITGEIDQVGGGQLTAPEDAAIYLLNFNGHAALVDAGCGRALARLMDNIRACGVDPDQIEYLLLTHCYAYDTTTSSWVNLGQLVGTSSNWSTTTFTLPSSLYDEAQSGLQVKIDIDSTLGYWGVTVGSSTLEAQCVPLPGTLMLLSSGLLGLAGWRRFRKG